MAEFLIETQGDENWVLSLDGSLIYVACNDGYLRTYDASTGELQVETFIGGDLDAIDIHPIDGLTLAITIGTLSNESGTGDDFTATAHVVLVDTQTYSIQTFDIPVYGNDRAFGDVAFHPVPYLLLTQNVEGGGMAPYTSLNIYDGTTARYDSYYSGEFAPSLTPIDGISLIGELGSTGTRYDIADGAGYDWDDSTTSVGLPAGALDYASGVEATTFNGWLTAIFANGSLYLFDVVFNYIATLDTYDGTSGAISALTFSEDGSTLFALDELAGTIVAYDMQTLEAGQPLQLNALPLEILPYGDEMVILEDTGFALINTSVGIFSIDIGPLFTTPTDPADNDILVGTPGDDVLDGGIGEDTMTGGLGDDTYYVDNPGDLVVELPNEGTDTVITSYGTYTLPDNVENLGITGDATDFALTGNELDNRMEFGTYIIDGLGSLQAYGLGGADYIDASLLQSWNGWTILLDGGEGNDTLFGSDFGYNQLYGSDGADLLYAAGAENDLYGGDGVDYLSVAGSGNATLDGGAGIDTLDASLATGYVFFWVDDTDDVVIVGSGVDTWSGNPTNYLHTTADYYVIPEGIFDVRFEGSGYTQTVVGTDSTNHFRGMDALDTAIGGGGNDYYYLNSGDATVIEDADGGYDRVSLITGSSYTMALNVEEATVFNDATLYGNEQDNVLAGQYGTFYGGAGNDTYRVWETGTIVEYADEGIDTVLVNYSYTLGANLENITYREFWHANGAQLTGNELDNVITGSNGNETLSGMGGSDTIYGDVEGADMHATYDADDIIHGGAGQDFLYGVYGNDTINGDEDVDYIYGGDGNDIVDGGHHSDRVWGEAGDDTLYGGTGWDRLDGGDGNDWMTGGNGTDFLFGGADDDEIHGGNGHDRAYGGTGADLIFGEDGNDRILGGKDDDTIDGGIGDDLLYGGAGNDVLLGGDGNDWLRGEWGKDILTGGAGADTFVFGRYETGKWLSSADVITDFSQADGDLIDLSAFDADTSSGADDEFTFIGDAAFSGTAGELRYSSDGSQTMVEGDVDGDGKADFVIVLDGDIALQGADFVL